MNEDDFGDDDSFDAIPDNTLQQLEQRAVSSTQRPRSNGALSAPKQPAKQIQTYGVQGLSRAGNANNGSWRPPQPVRQRQPSAAVSPDDAPPASAPNPPSSDYGFDDEDVIDLDEPSMVIQPTSTASALPTRPPPHPAAPSARRASRAPLDPETQAAFAAADAELGAVQSNQWTQAPHLQPPTNNNGLDVSALQSRIAELEAESARLRHAEQEARHAAQQKQGEIAIVRSNQQKAAKEYERQIAVIQKLRTDAETKAKAELAQGRKEREKMETDNRFLQHDLAQESERAKRLNGPAKSRADTAAEGGTPRKNKRAAWGDGFADEEVKMISPSKSKDKSREQTPKVGAKRKRAAQDSPLPALSFTQPPGLASNEGSRGELPREHIAERQSNVAKVDDRFEFIQRLLNHCPYEGHESSLEALTKHNLPSDTSRSLNSILLARLSSAQKPCETESPLLLKLSFIVLDLWSQCLTERHHAPIYLLLDLLRFALRFELASTIAQLIPAAVPICTRTIDLLATPTVLAFRYPNAASSAEHKKTIEDMTHHIDVDEVLDFLHLLCNAATVEGGEKKEQFWKSVEFTFILLILNKAQPISQITTALRMLATSTTATTFGPLCTRDGEGGKQTKQEKDLLDRLTSLLFEIPLAPSDEPAYTDAEIASLRTEILEVLEQLCLTDHGTWLLRQHRSAVGRLVRFLHAQVGRLYSTRPSLGLEEGDARGEAHEGIVKTVNEAMRVLYHLLFHSTPSAVPAERAAATSVSTSFGGVGGGAITLDLPNKLTAVKGGYHKFLVSMTRLAFSDQLVLEHGIEDAAVEAAHAILDCVLSPEEGEAVLRGFETPGGTGSRSGRGIEGADTTEMETSQESGGFGADDGGKGVG